MQVFFLYRNNYTNWWKFFWLAESHIYKSNYETKEKTQRYILIVLTDRSGINILQNPCLTHFLPSCLLSLQGDSTSEKKQGVPFKMQQQESRTTLRKRKPKADPRPYNKLSNLPHSTPVQVRTWCNHKHTDWSLSNFTSHWNSFLLFLKHLSWQGKYGVRQYTDW
jgi:hypothetical protein